MGRRIAFGNLGGGIAEEDPYAGAPGDRQEEEGESPLR